MDRTTKARISGVLIFAVTFAVAFFATKYFFSGDSIDAELKKTAETINKNCPAQVDADTRLDNTEAFAGAIQYNYTLVNVSREDTAFDISRAKKFVEEQAQQNLDTHRQMALFREKDVSIKYHYKDKNGKYLFDFTIKPQHK